MKKAKITDECIQCGGCEHVCPTQAISAGADKYVVDKGKCVFCQACIAMCPVSAIIEEPAE